MDRVDPLLEILGEPKPRKPCGELDVSARVTHVQEWIDNVLDGAVFCEHGSNAG